MHLLKDVTAENVLVGELGGQVWTSLMREAAL